MWVCGGSKRVIQVSNECKSTFGGYSSGCIIRVATVPRVASAWYQWNANVRSGEVRHEQLARALRETVAKAARRTRISRRTRAILIIWG
jgi:murein endopeptidase